MSKLPKAITIGFTFGMEMNEPIRELEELLEGMKRIRDKKRYKGRRCSNCQDCKALECTNKENEEIFLERISFATFDASKEFNCPRFTFATPEELEERYALYKEIEKEETKE